MVRQSVMQHRVITVTNNLKYQHLINYVSQDVLLTIPFYFLFLSA
jgi:hypothetical protein